MHQIRASIFMIKGQFEAAIKELQKTLYYFRLEKKREMQKQFI